MIIVPRLIIHGYSWLDSLMNCCSRGTLTHRPANRPLPHIASPLDPHWQVLKAESCNYFVLNYSPVYTGWNVEVFTNCAVVLYTSMHAKKKTRQTTKVRTFVKCKLSDLTNLCIMLVTCSRMIVSFLRKPP